jgi:phosphate transport system protein
MTPQGTARHFHQELSELKGKLLQMSGEAEEMVRLSVAAFAEQDPGKAQSVLDRDRKVDELELEIDRMVHELLATQQPMASDLRFITMTMQICNDLERVGDHAVNVARSVQQMAGMPPLGRAPEIVEMALLASEMLSDSLDAFVRSDPMLAREICRRDDRVDHLYNAMFRILLTHMMEDPRRIGPSMSLLLVSKNLERIADLATNISEDVVFLVEGVNIKHGGGKRAASAEPAGA